MRARASLVVLVLMFGSLTPAVAASVKDGSRCTKKGATTVTSGTTFKCTLINRKLIWKPQPKVVSPPSVDPSLIDARYLDLVEMPDGSKLCPQQTGYESSEVVLKNPAQVFGVHRIRTAATGEKVCITSLIPWVAREFPKLLMSKEAINAINRWSEFKKSRPENGIVTLNFILDPQGDLKTMARDIAVFRNSASVFAPELGPGQMTLVIGYSDQFIFSLINSDKTTVTMEQAIRTWGGQERLHECYGNYWEPEWQPGGPKPATLGDITLCNHRMYKSPAPDGAHTASHEFTHAVQAATKNGSWTEFNKWWTEGGAFFFGSLLASDVGLLDLERNRAFWVYRLATETDLRTLEELAKHDSGSRLGGFLGVEYFVSKFGVNAYFDVMKKQSELRPPFTPGEPVGNLAAAFKAVTGHDFVAFINEANAYIANQVAVRMKQ